jgi:hypothetical protein
MEMYADAHRSAQRQADRIEALGAAGKPRPLHVSPMVQEELARRAEKRRFDNRPQGKRIAADIARMKDDFARRGSHGSAPPRAGGKLTPPSR